MFEKSTFLYYLFFALGFVSVSIFAFIYRKKFGISWQQVLIIVPAVYVPVVVWMFFLFWAESGFKEFGGNNIVRIFIWVPLFALPVAKILKIPFKNMVNFLAPLPCAVHGIAHFGCIFEGCCYGYPATGFAIWNPATRDYRFPIQPIEAIVAIMIIVLVVIYTRSKKYAQEAQAYPIMLMLFGSTRFFLEFLRAGDKLFWGISSLAIHAFVMFVVGVVWYFVERHIQKKKALNNPIEQPKEETV